MQSISRPAHAIRAGVDAGVRSSKRSFTGAFSSCRERKVAENQRGGNPDDKKAAKQRCGKAEQGHRVRIRIRR
jgi:hypothetical protein